MLKANQILQKQQKKHGAGFGSFGGALTNYERVPTGVFPLDLAMGGGFPRGKMSIIYGSESSGKTNLLLLAMANHQRLWPDKTNVFYDIENTLDPGWATKLGVDMTKVIVLRPDYGEQIVDSMVEFLSASDCGLVGLDSIATIITTQEITSSAEKALVGSNALLMNKMVRQTTSALGQAEKIGNWPTLIMINQIRFKIGVMYGDPETVPGGNAQHFQASIKLRTYAKDIMDESVSKKLPVRKGMSVVVKKWKVPITAKKAEFEVVMIPHAGYKSGQCMKEWNTIYAMAQAHGLLSKEGSKWQFDGKEYLTLKAIKEQFQGDSSFTDKYKTLLIGMEVARENDHLGEEGEVSDDEEKELVDV